MARARRGETGAHGEAVPRPSRAPLQSRNQSPQGAGILDAQCNRVVKTKLRRREGEEARRFELSLPGTGEIVFRLRVGAGANSLCAGKSGRAANARRII